MNEFDEMLEADLEWWREQKEIPEQLWLAMEAEIDEQEDRGNDYD